MLHRAASQSKQRTTVIASCCRSKAQTKIAICCIYI